MYTSDKKRVFNHLLLYAASALFSALFGAVYEHFSHEVYSYYMIYAFLLPLGLGVLPLGWLLLKEGTLPSLLSLRLWGSGIAALTVGSHLKGALDIYGSSSRFLPVYPVLALPLMLTGAVLFALQSSEEKLSAGGQK